LATEITEGEEDTERGKGLKAEGRKSEEELNGYAIQLRGGKD
jgi:hypothetical protein